MTKQTRTDIKVFDNGGDTCDRYTVVYLATLHRGNYESRGMSCNPNYPTGFGQWCEVSTDWVDTTSDNVIEFDALPDACKLVVNKDLEGFK